MPWHMPWHEHRSAIHALPRLVRAMGAILPLLSHRKPGSRRGSSSEPDWEQVGSVGKDISPIEKAAEACNRRQLAFDTLKMAMCCLNTVLPAGV